MAFSNIPVVHPVFAPVVSGIIRRFGDPARGIDETVFVVVGKAVVADGIIVAQKVTVHTVVVPDIEGGVYADRQTLWNAVEKAERGKNAQLAYSFDIALQNEFSLEENIALARQFLLENFVRRGMVVDFAVHQPDREDGGIPNPHFHVLCPIRPIEQNGKWGLKQRRVYELDEDGNRIRDQNGEFVFNAVPTTDWGSPETLEYWRQTWAELCNAKFAEKGLDVRIDHRSYERQGVELLPTVHEGATVRAMEKKGIRTEKGEFNRWIRATNAVIRDIKKKIALLFDWIAEAKAELAKPQAPNLVSLLNAYYTSRRAGAYSQKGKVSNLKEMNETFNYLRANGIYSLEDLEHRVSEHSAATESLKKTLDEQTARMKAIKQLYDSSAAFQSLKPVYDGLQKIKFEKPRAKYKAEHEAELKQFYAARRKLTGEFPDGKVDRAGGYVHPVPRCQPANAGLSVPVRRPDDRLCQGNLDRHWRGLTEKGQAVEPAPLTSLEKWGEII